MEGERMAEAIDRQKGDERSAEMHVINAWLPPPVAEQARREAGAFSSVVRSVQGSWRPDDPDSVFSTLKWISLIDAFLKARSEINMVDVEALVVIGFEMFQAARNKLYAQVRWGNVLIRLLKKHGKKISVKVKWRPLYDSLVDAHFKRNTGPEGWRLKQHHFETITSLVRCCRKYFSAGAASEIWNEFRYSLENPWNNASFEGCGFLQLFLPVNVQNEEFFTREWIKQCINLWESVPNCHFWDVQWASVLARCIKNFNSLDWELFLPALFTKYLNMFEVPVPSGNGSYPFPLDIPKSTAFLFSKKSGSTAKAISVSIVYLLKPGSSAIEHFKKFADLLEQYYHPSNGGRWTGSLERLLRYLVITFQRRLQDELNLQSKYPEYHLGKAERASFVEVVMKLIDRGQYSKNESLSETVSVAMSILSYVEPSLMLPFITSRFHMALETVTATHQLKTAISSVAFSSRAFFFASASSSLSDTFSGSASLDILMVSLSSALLGMDANDPPKTLATMQLIGSIFSNLAAINEKGPPVLETIIFSDWLDEFFSRLFALLLHLEPRSVLHEDAHISSSSGTFLVEDNPYFFAMLEVVLGKLSKPLYMQSLRKISKFVNTNILPGAIAEVGLLCCACVSANPEEAAHHIIEPVLMKIVSSLQESPVSGYGGKGILDASFSPKATISPALETSLEYHLKVLSVAISYAGSALLSYKEKLKLAISSAFEAPSWKVNGAGDHLLRSTLGSLVLYYPRNQYKCFSCHPACSVLEDWMQTKFKPEEIMRNQPEWHIPCEDELEFANELLSIHFCSALNDLLTICGIRLHSEAGNEKDHLKVTLLRIFSSLQGVLSCLPELRPFSNLGKMKIVDRDHFFIAGASGATIGSSEMREKAAHDIHVACKYVLGERTDDSILLLLLIRIMDAIANIGSLENEEWSNHMQAWKLESASIIEPSCNFIVPTQTKGKKRPRWALIDKTYMHNTWRSSQSFYHKFRTDSDMSPPNILVLLMEDLLNLSLHRYETVRSLASRSLIKIFKRWPSLISNSVGSLSAKLLDSSTKEHEVLGCCAVLGSQTVLKHLTMDAGSFSSFILGLLASSHHESLKAQKSITELFIKYNINFSGAPRSLFSITNDHSEGGGFADLISRIRAIGFDSNGLHWRYDLMANRVLLLLILTSRRDSNLSSKILLETTGHFLKNLSSQLPQSRMLAVSALNALLSGRHHTNITQDKSKSSALSSDPADSISNELLCKIFQEEGFFDKTLTSLSHVHIISDTDGASKGHHGKSLQTTSDKAITLFYFDFSASWPRTLSWVSLLRNHTFYSSFARIFKRLAQECGLQTFLALKSTLEELLNTKEKPKQCVAAEAMAGILHSDIDGLLDVSDSWIMVQLQKIIASPSMESMPEWAACIRYAVTGKGKYGRRVPVLRNKILDTLLCPLPITAATNIVTKRYAFLLSVFTEISPMHMITEELDYHHNLMEELLENMCHSSAQVREMVGAILPILCSNLRLFTSSMHINADRVVTINSIGGESWAQVLLDQASERAVNIQNPLNFENLHISTDSSNENGSLSTELQNDIKRMETMFHFIISAFKSGRSSFLLDIIVGFLYPVIALQETSHKDMSTLAKAAFELLKWRILSRPHLENAISVLSLAANDPNWRTRNASLSYLRVFMYRHVFILSDLEKQKIWTNVEKLLIDSQVEVREHAAGVLAGLMKGGDQLIISSFRERSFAVAEELNRKRKQRNWNAIRSIASAHGAVLALAASVISVPYDMPSWLPAHVTLLARFISEPSPIKTTVTKAVAEFRRTHADTWIIQKDLFTDEQLEVLADTSSSASYFA